MIDDKEPEDEERRFVDPNDKHRAQPTARDRSIVRSWINYHFHETEENGYHRLQAHREYIERKLGLLVADIFNFGFRCGEDRANGKNGFDEGYKKAVESMRAALEEMKKP